jgi:hypothetical protein
MIELKTSSSILLQNQIFKRKSINKPFVKNAEISNIDIGSVHRRTLVKQTGYGSLG